MWLLASILDSTHLIRLWQVRWSWPQNLINVILKFVKASQALIKHHRTKTMFFNSWFSTYVFHSPSRGLSSNLLCNEGRAEMCSPVRVSLWSVLYRPRIIHLLLNQHNVRALHLPYERNGQVVISQEAPLLGSDFQGTYKCTACCWRKTGGENSWRIIFFSWLKTSTWWYVENRLLLVQANSCCYLKNNRYDRTHTFFMFCVRSVRIYSVLKCVYFIWKKM